MNKVNVNYEEIRLILDWLEMEAGEA